MRISDWSSDVCSSDLQPHTPSVWPKSSLLLGSFASLAGSKMPPMPSVLLSAKRPSDCAACFGLPCSRALSALIGWPRLWRSEEHTSELQSLMRISYAVFCLKKKNENNVDQSPSYHIIISYTDQLS